MRTYSIASSLLALTVLSYAHLHPVPQQVPIMDQSDTNTPGIQLPPSDDGSTTPPPPPQHNLILSDVMGNSRSFNIFAGFTRDIDSVSTRLDSSSSNSTILAPLNKAITALPRKPWEDPREYASLGANAYEGKDGEDRAHRNLRRFTEAHIVPVSPWQQGEKVKSLGGSTLWWEVKEDGKAYVQPGDVEVERVANRVNNGQVWVLKEVLKVAS